jgi:hypothetical protein
MVLVDKCSNFFSDAAPLQILKSVAGNGYNKQIVSIFVVILNNNYLLHPESGQTQRTSAETEYISA